MINVHCPHCRVGIRAPDKCSGRLALCPKCKQEFLVPSIRQTFSPNQKNEEDSDEEVLRMLGKAPIIPAPLPPTQEFQPVAKPVEYIAYPSDEHRPFSSIQSSIISQPDYLHRTKKEVNRSSYYVTGGVLLVFVLVCGSIYTIVGAQARSSKLTLTSDKSHGANNCSPKDNKAQPSNQPKALPPKDQPKPIDNISEDHAAKAKDMIPKHKEREEILIPKEQQQQEKDHAVVEHIASNSERHKNEDNNNQGKAQQRIQLLRDLKNKKTEDLLSLQVEYDKYVKSIDKLQTKIIDIKKRAGIKTDNKAKAGKRTNIGLENGNLINSLQSSPKFQRAMTQVDEVNTDIEKIQQDIKAIQIRMDEKTRDYMMKERQIIFTYFQPGDPVYTEYLGMFYTESELKAVKEFVADHGTAWGAGDWYMRGLLKKGTVQTAEHNENRGAQRSGLPGGGQDLFYNVRYVSRGGMVMEKVAYVNVITIPASKAPPLDGKIYLPYEPHPNESFSGEYWTVSADTKMAVLPLVP